MTIYDEIGSILEDEPQQVVHYATVLGSGDGGTVWVQLDGGADRTPCEANTSSYRPGDRVRVEISGGRAEVLGNYTDPSAGVRHVREVEGIAQDAAEAAEAAAKDAATAQSIASEAQAVAEATGQHFWSDDGGAHVTDVTRDEWESAVEDNFSDYDPDSKPYHNQLLNSLGILLRTALNNLVSITKSAIAFYDGIGNAASNIVARFGADGAQIGKSDESHLTLDYRSMQMVDKRGNTYFHVKDLRDRSGANSYTVQLQPSLSHAANELMTIGAVYDIDSFDDECTVLFDGEPYAGTVEPIYDDPDDYFASVFGWKPIVGVTVGESVTGQYDRWTMLVEAENPFEIALTFGERNPDKITAGGSSVFGSYCEASGFNSFATGMTTKAVGAFSKADGIASTSRGLCAEASGRESTAAGDYSHAQNLGTRASSASQTAMGRYNVEDTSDTYALIVGNGSDGSNRSNAQAIRWNGLTDVAGRTAYPLFVYATAPDEADLPVTPCFVLATGDYGLWYYDGN